MLHDVVIVGAGISGLSLAWEIVRRRPEIDLLVVEASQKVGGTMRTVEVDGYRIERGPNGFLDRGAETLDLIDSLGLTPELAPSSDAAAVRYVYCRGTLEALPSGPRGFLGTNLIPLSGKLRVLGEPFISRAAAGTEETVAAFVRRRLGPHMLDAFVDPFISGIVAGDPERLSVDAAFPRLRAIEQEYGSLIKGAIRIARQRKRAGGSGEVSAGPTGRLISLRRGMSSLPHTIADRLGAERVRTGVRVAEISRRSSGVWRVQSPAGDTEARSLILATPAPESAGFIEAMASPAADRLRSVPYAPVAVAALGFQRDQIAHPLEAFGFLCPEREKRPILGCLFSSSVFPGLRAPPSHVLLRAFLGGDRHPERLVGSRDAICHVALEELRRTLEITGPPAHSQVILHPQAIPQYRPGHRELVDTSLSELQEAAPGLHFHGNSYTGIGVNDCTRASVAMAETVIAELGEAGG